MTKHYIVFHRGVAVGATRHMANATLMAQQASTKDEAAQIAVFEFFGWLQDLDESPPPASFDEEDTAPRAQLAFDFGGDF